MGNKKKVKKVEKKEEIAEDWCFQCYEGGSLLVCDYKHCLKAYHIDCVRNDESLIESHDPWFCKRHSCYQCKKSSKYQCCGCPNAVCKNCIDKVDFACVKGKALCHHCVKLALLGEEGVDVDSDGECVDFKDLETCEGLFYDYWKKLVKDKEKLTLEDLQSADIQIKKGVTFKTGYKSKDSDNEEDFQPITGSDSDDNSDGGDDNEDENENDGSNDDKIDDVDRSMPKLMLKRKRSNLMKNQGPKSKTVIPKSKKEISSWGSKPLLDFLTSMGEDTTNKYEVYKVAYIIHKYAEENKLLHKVKPRKIVCDEKLKGLLGRKMVDKSKIVDLLEPHYPEFFDSSEDEKEETKCCPKLKENDITELFKKQKIVISHKKSEEPVRAPQSYFAFVISDNIKLVFLKKSLVQELLKDHENFESKVVGSFVRVKLDTGVGSRRYSFQLLQVTGINKMSKADSSEVLLQVTTLTKDISISLLSDDYFSEEECEELRKKVKAGLIKRPTIVELEQRAKYLHEDITKHWIAKELITLQNRIDHANEKGRRREFYECYERQRLLQSPEEQSRLLRKVPNIIPDMTDDEPMANSGEQILGKSLIEESQETPSSNGEHNGTNSDMTEDEPMANSGEQISGKSLIDESQETPSSNEEQDGTNSDETSQAQQMTETIATTEEKRKIKLAYTRRKRLAERRYTPLIQVTLDVNSTQDY